MPPTHRLLLVLACVLGAAFPLSAQDRKHNAIKSGFGTYGDNGLPFFGQTVDARNIGNGWPADNLTPRGIVLHLGGGIHACFDTDLLRIALVWKGNDLDEYLTMNGMAPGSYRVPHRKAGAGQGNLPTPIGTPLLANPIIAGWHQGKPKTADPRAPSVDPDEIGRGPLPPDQGRWIGLRLDRESPTLVYEIFGTRIEERLSAREENGKLVFSRLIWIEALREDVTLAVAETRYCEFYAQKSGQVRRLDCIFTPGERQFELEVVRAKSFNKLPPVGTLWAGKVSLALPAADPAPGPFAVEAIPLPVPNPWKRNVRPASLDFFPDGRLAVLTFDGDVWIGEDGGDTITWRRFAGGLHEPMGLRIEKEQILVFDRNGLVRLRDRDGNGEADFYETVSNLAAQTAETREFAMGFELKPGGGYYLAKGGQVATTRGKLNGSVVELSADDDLEVVATGLRQPFITVDPKTGLLTASDQQGHWVPATPLHVLKRGSYYGFQPKMLGPDANKGRSITEPPLWIPHFVNQSGARQVWLRDAKMGALNDALIHLGYNRPAIFKIFLDEDASQGALAPLLEGFPTGLLDGRVNPADGLLYLGGLNLWGSVGKEIRGLVRVRPTGEPSWVPRDLRAFQEGVLLRFDHELDESLARSLTSYTIDRWNYQRTVGYGSGHYKLDGLPGQETLPVASVLLSQDRRSIFLGIPDMKPVHTLRVTYRVAGNDDAPQVQQAYFTIHHLDEVALEPLGFSERKVDFAVTESSKTGPLHVKPTAAEGRKVAETYGCVGCHTTDGSKAVNQDPNMVVGPSWKGLYGSKRTFTDGTVVKKADEVYLRESILDPARNVTVGFETGKTGVGMPSYLGVLNDGQIESLILYIESLGK